MKTIDAHHHFWHYTPEAFGWLDDSMAVLRRDHLADELKREIDRAGVDGVISVEARATLDETDFLLGLAAEHPWVLGVVGKAPVTRGEAAVRAYLEQALPQPKLVGVRHVLQGESAGFTAAPDFNTGLAALKEHGLRFDLCIYERQLPEIIDLVDRHPEQVFVLDHIAKPRIKDNEVEPWATHLRALSERPHVYCKLSGLVTEADWARWTPEQLGPYLDTALSCFGADRLMFGTDWPVCRLGVDYGDWVALVRDYAGTLSDAEQAALFGETAVVAYRLDVA